MLDELSVKYGACFPKDIKSMLDEYVISQDNAKKILSTAMYNHLIRILSRELKCTLPKSNVILVGDSGVGKTFLVETLAKMFDIPLYIADMTSYTQTGWRGGEISEIINSLIIQAKHNMEKAKYGIVLLDEVDKGVFAPSSSGSDINGKGVQQSLLKMIEGTDFNLEGGKIFNTRNVLFIFGGAFNGLEKIIAKRLKKDKSGMGFGKAIKIAENTSKTEVTHEDLIAYGFLPEFIGRIPLIAALQPLSKDDLRDILIESKNSILYQYIELFHLYGIDLSFSFDYVSYVVEEAVGRGIGARGLKSIVDTTMIDLMFTLPGSGVKEYKVESPNKKILMLGEQK